MPTQILERPSPKIQQPPPPVKKAHNVRKFIITGILFFLAASLVIGGIKFLQFYTMIKGGQPPMPPTTVTSAPVRAEHWAPELTAVGSVAAVQGAMLAAELPGTVAEVKFDNGTRVKKGDVLVQLDVSSEEAQLRSAEADAGLARVAEERARNLRKDNVISQSEFDTADATFKQKVAQVDNMRAIIAKKTIRAPFDGEAGIRQVNPGQMVPAGQQIVSLQALDPIFVNFALPQQRLSELKEGLVVRVTTDAVPGHQFKGKLTAINSQVDEVTRNIQVQATLENKERLLQPGMFVTATVILPQEQTTIVIPATAISYAPFGDSVFVIEKKHDEKTKKDGLVLRQQFIRTGETRGDFVAVTEGLKPGEQVASTGVFKLRNGASVVIDNKMAPNPQLHPTPPNS
ncbi:MAG TPA: efflux RND transporter periplasmic adaptor subunit [Chthoniobacterales bacterium]|nr:efflux RND transporter periplasmic adaptor subunit [Chthoniobacterales bacterium]